MILNSSDVFLNKNLMAGRWRSHSSFVPSNQVMESARDWLLVLTTLCVVVERVAIV